MTFTQLIATSLCAVSIFAGTTAMADTTTMPRADRLAQAATVIDNYNDALPQVRSAWLGFDPVAFPKIIVMRNAAGDAKALIAFDHPNPDALGEAVPVEIGEGTAHVIFAPLRSLRINDFEYFEFSRPVAGAQTFLIASNCSLPDDPMACAETRDFAAFFMHEAFHRYQDDAFRAVKWADQSTYNYDPDFIHATLIENILFAEAAQDRDPVGLRALVRELVGVRAYRRSMSDVVALDEAQERIEGTANFVENHVAEGDILPSELLTAALEQGWVRDELGFGRFYITGRVAIELAERLGADDYAARLTTRETPMELLASMVEPAAPEVAFRRAVERLDPDGTLRQEAERYAAWAQNEPSIFDDE